MLNNSLFLKNKYTSILKIPEKIFLVLINVFISFFSLAQQNYPIQLNVQLIPPYSGYLPDYATAGNEKLKVILLQKDLTQPMYNVRLAMKLEGNGYTISTKPFFKGQPISLQAGVPVEISGSDIYDFLNSVNLDFSGLNKNTYEQGQALPEGYYSICFTAYDYNSPTPSQVSNQSCAQAWMTLSDPPFLNMPICGSTVQTNTPQNVVFGWTPMNTGSPNSANQTEYIFELWETRPDNNANPNNIVLSAPPVQTYTTDFTTYNYGMTETQLIAGMQYIWRVRAHDKSNRDLFKNQGYSQICTFVYGSIYDGLNLNLTANSQGTSYRQGKVWWNGLSVFTQYTIQYRKVNGATSTWFTAYSTTPELKINDLEENTAYEAKVQGIANDGYIGPWSNTTTFTTPTKPVIACGDQIVPQPGQAIVPLAFATQGMRFKAGLFEVLVTSVQGGAGYFSGTGKVFVPMFGSLLNVTFDNVFVDDNQTVLSGNFYAVTKGVTNWLHDWETLNDSLNNVFTNFNNTNDTTTLINSLQQMCQQVQQSGDSAFINAFNGVLSPTTSNNNTPLFCSNDDNAIKQYLASHPNTVNNFQSNLNTVNNANSLGGGIFCIVNESDNSDINISLSDAYIAKAEEMVAKRYQLDYNTKNIWSDLSSDFIYGYKNDNELKILFPPNATIGEMQDKFCQFLQLMELIWQDHFIVQFLHGKNGWQQERNKVTSASGASNKASKILARHNKARAEWFKWEIIGSNLTEWFVAVVAFSDGAQPNAFTKKRNIRFTNSNYSQGQNIGKIIKGSAQEIAEAKTKIQNHRVSVGAGTSGNYGYLEGTINNTVVNNKMWRSVSSADAVNEIHIFDAIEATGNSGNSWLRITDSEYRMLNDLANSIGASKGNVYSSINGTLKIVSENPYCKSCSGVIQQFHDMFPNVKLILIDGVK